MANGFLLFVKWCQRTIYAGDTEEIEKRASAQWKDRLVDRLFRELDFECKASREKWFVNILGSPMVPQTLIMNPTNILEFPKHRESLAIRGVDTTLGQMDTSSAQVDPQVAPMDTTDLKSSQMGSESNHVDTNNEASES